MSELDDVLNSKKGKPGIYIVTIDGKDKMYSHTVDGHWILIDGDQDWDKEGIEYHKFEEEVKDE